MSSIKHGSLAAATGVTLTGCLLHEKRTSIEETAVEVFDEAGLFETGKGIRKKVSHSHSGECLSTAALPTVGSGAATSSSPRIDKSDETEKSEGAADFSVEDHYWENGTGDFS